MEFEPLAGKWFRLQGYGVVETGGSGPEGGMDPVLIKGGETVLKMCTCSKRLGSVYSNRLKVDVTKNSRDNDL